MNPHWLPVLHACTHTWWKYKALKLTGRYVDCLIITEGTESCQSNNLWCLLHWWLTDQPTFHFSLYWNENDILTTFSPLAAPDVICDNLSCRQWWKCHHNDNISISGYVQKTKYSCREQLTTSRAQLTNTALLVLQIKSISLLILSFYHLSITCISP